MPPTLAYYSAILGGCGNQISDAGGSSNTACYSSILGGQSNIITNCYSSIAGGSQNTASGAFAFATGELNNAAGDTSFVAGYNNKAIGAGNAVFGALNYANSNNTTVFGAENRITGTQAFGAGYLNTGSGYTSTVFGQSNCAIGSAAFVGGSDSCAGPFGLEAQFSFGQSNHNRGNISAIIGGCNNILSGSCSIIGSGFNNNICTGVGNAIIGGAGNLICRGNHSLMVGGSSCLLIDTCTDGYSLVAGLCNEVNGDASYSFTAGYYNTNFSSGGAAVGNGAVASKGATQFAFGCGITTPTGATSANGDSQFVVGKFNTHNHGQIHRFAVGNGSSDASRSTVFNVTSAGRTGICRTAPSYPLDVNGTARVTTLIESSALKYKENIISLQDQLDNIKKLKPVEFEWKDTKKKDFGLIAEDVEKIYPYLVEYDDDKELTGVKYSKLTSVLVKAIQEQQEQIDKLKTEVELLKQNK